MADTIREVLERLLAVIKPKYTDPDEIVAIMRAIAAARAALAAEPPAPAEPVATLHVSDFRGYENYDFQHLVDLPPGHYKLFTACTAQPPEPAEPDTDAVLTLAHLRRCPHHGQLPANAWGCPECLRELREELARLRGSAADGEREELASALEVTGSYEIPSYEQLRRAAALLREARPQPMPVADRPWERPGWCDAEGRCWWFAPTEAISGGFRCAGWSLYAADPADEDTHCLPHWAIAIPQPPQGGEVEA